MRWFIYEQGQAVRVRRGAFPMDPELVGRHGLVVEIDPYRPGRYGVVLNEEDRQREFSEDELEPVAPPVAG